jgi:membrane protein YdbS with pleckstrin-like domain
VDEFEELKRMPTRVDLRKRFPISIRTIFARSFWFLLAVIFVAISYVFLELNTSTDPGFAIIDEGVRYVLSLCFRAVLAISIVKFVYEILYFMTYGYITELEHLTITQGIFFRYRASVPIARINDASLRRNPIQLLFGIYSLTILTASPTADYAVIEGLSKKNAVQLQAFILTLVETTLPDVKESAAEKMVAHRTVSAEYAEKLLHGDADAAVEENSDELQKELKFG